MKNVFEEIIKGTIPCDKVFENDRILAFNDIAPQAPVHVLIIPKKSLTNIATASQEDEALLGEMLLVAKAIARKLGIEENFRIVTNNGPEAGQGVFHLHFHLLGGRPLSGRLG